MKSKTEAVHLLEEIRSLMELRGENPFKVRAFERASQQVAGLPVSEDLVARARQGTLTELSGVGKGIADVLTEFLVQGTSRVRDELAQSLPPGLKELTSVPGLGPKKAIQLIEELGIHSLAELEYACKENRLPKLKGFGAKAQAKILEGIQFRKSTQGQLRLVDGMEAAQLALHRLHRAANSGRHPAAYGFRVFETGALRRRLEILSSLDFLVEVPPGERAAAEIRDNVEREARELEQSAGLPIVVHFALSSHLGYWLARTTATEEHWRGLGSPAEAPFENEDGFYRSLGLPPIPPEARETGREIELARSGELLKLLPVDGLKGVFHNHTTRSDGTASLEQMVVAAKALGYRYIGISDHSQSAAYAQGLKLPDLLDQEREVREVQERYPEIRVFWGIESDILADGSLDYDEEALKRFDFVIASIHSRFQMDRAAMTERVLRAIRHPRTRFLGHVTGRLLLGRKGFDIDMERVIEEAAAHDVAIEINANPARLEIDWRWGERLRAARTPVSVNPDAHETEGLKDTAYGVMMARKALLPSSQIVNSRSVEEIERWLRRG